MVFRDQQDFIDRGPEFYRQWGSHFGRLVVFFNNFSQTSIDLEVFSLHIHPTSGHPAGYPEVHLVYRYMDFTYFVKWRKFSIPICFSRDLNKSFNFEYDDAVTPTVWHSDVSYELQPPGLTTFFLLAQPKSGGDTLFTSQVSTLKKLSAPFVAFLRTLKAVHSGFEQAEFSKGGRRGGVVRRDPVEHIHPVIRRHPVTGDEAIYVNRQFTRRIVGLKREESGMFITFLYYLWKIIFLICDFFFSSIFHRNHLEILVRPHR